MEKPTIHTSEGWTPTMLRTDRFSPTEPTAVHVVPEMWKSVDCASTTV
jgi:hypothetical protein